MWRGMAVMSIASFPPTSLEALAYANRSFGTVSGLNW